MPPYGRYNRRRRMLAVKPKTSARKYTGSRKSIVKTPKVTFTQKVQKLLLQMWRINTQIL